MKPPKKWKMAILTWIAIYPTITFLFLAFGNHLAMLYPMPLRTLIITLLVVPLMVYVLIPMLQKLMAPWLRT